MMHPFEGGELPLMEGTICEAFGCSSRATTRIVLPMGHKGSIPVYVCDECVTKFQERSLV
jgi:hypothetical protein